MSPDKKNTLTTDGYIQDNGYTTIIDDTQYEWFDSLCILRPSDTGSPQRFISISDNGVVVRVMDKIFGVKIDEDKIFFKLRSGVKPGSYYCKVLDWELEDYESVISDKDIMYRLKNTITTNPTYIEEMKSNLRELRINKLLKDGDQPDR